MSGHKAKKNRADQVHALSTPPTYQEEEAMAKDLPRGVPTKQAAQMMGIGQEHIRQLLGRGKLRGIRLGHDWLVFSPSIETYLENRSPKGRPSSGVLQAQGTK